MADSARVYHNLADLSLTVDPINWRAGCWKTACPVRREGELSLSLPLSFRPVAENDVTRRVLPRFPPRIIGLTRFPAGKPRFGRSLALAQPSPPKPKSRH